MVALQKERLGTQGQLQLTGAGSVLTSPGLARRLSPTAHKPTDKAPLASELGTKHLKVSAKPEQTAVLSRRVPISPQPAGQ